MGIHIYWIDSLFNNRHALLTVRLSYFRFLAGILRIIGQTHHCVANIRVVDIITRKRYASKDESSAVQWWQRAPIAQLTRFSPYFYLQSEQVKLYCPDPNAAESDKAAAMLWKIFQARIEDFGLKVTDFASCTTDNESGVKSMCVNHARGTGILWDQCTSHMTSKAFEHAFGTSNDPAKPNSLAARNLIKLIIKVIGRCHRSQAWRTKFEDLQVTRDIVSKRFVLQHKVLNGERRESGVVRKCA